MIFQELTPNDSCLCQPLLLNSGRGQTFRWVSAGFCQSLKVRCINCKTRVSRENGFFLNYFYMHGFDWIIHLGVLSACQDKTFYLYLFNIWDIVCLYSSFVTALWITSAFKRNQMAKTNCSTFYSRLRIFVFNWRLKSMSS